MGVSSCGFKSHPRHHIDWRSFTEHRGDVAKWLRRRSAKPLFGGSSPPVASIPLQLPQASPGASLRILIDPGPKVM